MYQEVCTEKFNNKITSETEHTSSPIAVTCFSFVITDGIFEDI